MGQLALCGKIENHLVELLNKAAKSKMLKKNLYTDWDWKLKLAFPNLIIPLLFGNGNPKIPVNPRLDVKWEAPEPGWHKINFDGAFAGNPRRSGIGCCIRDSEGICIKEISKDIGLATNNEAKFRATLRGLQLGSELGIKRIHLERDSLNVINIVHSNHTPSWLLNLWLRPMVGLLETFKGFQISHIYREGNLEADRLSKMAIVDGGLDPGIRLRHR
ncbi:uncharacterized protein LOC131858153 [Cryptomeria japonica]|uniref:uncharacterized protein LOC131858153 n=1 Tax=Cryptomeria japonica TaxID=3369 RepID=UPI0027DA9C2F|nr:uncharacterized protein LOC131858153 [Cryptomeria japonica]